MFLNYFKKILETFSESSSQKNTDLNSIMNNRNFLFEKEKRISFLPYKNQLVAQKIKDLKFHKKLKNADEFAEIIYENLPDILNEISIKNNFNNPLLVTVPLH